MTDVTTDEMPTHQVCSTCGENKPLIDFSPNGGGKLRAQCKRCRSVTAKAERTTECLDCGTDISHRKTSAVRCESCQDKHAKQLNRERYLKDRINILKRVRDRWFGFTAEERRDQQRRTQRLSKFGLTPEDYEDMLTEQGGVCAICKKPETHTYKGRVTELVVDHDRGCCPGKKSCGACIRGLLCHNCNAALGMFRDSLDSLTAAYMYLKAHAKKRLGLVA